jgi:hypothetical protein
MKSGMSHTGHMIGKHIRIEADASGEFSGLTRLEVQVDVECLVVTHWRTEALFMAWKGTATHTHLDVLESAVTVVRDTNPELTMRFITGKNMCHGDIGRELATAWATWATSNAT